MKKEILICDCNSSEHQIIIRYFEDDPVKEVYLDIHLTKGRRNFFTRLWYGLKYAFGYKSKFGAWDEFVFNKGDVDKLKRIVEYLEK